MAQSPSEKLTLGAQMSKEFLGEELLTKLRANTVSCFTIDTILFFVMTDWKSRATIFSREPVRNTLRKFAFQAMPARA